MQKVYVIKSVNRNYIYVGMTGYLDKRLKCHNKGWNKTTSSYAPFTLLYEENFDDRVSARIKEKYLKSRVGKEFLKRLI